MNNLKTLRKQHKKTIEQVIQHIGISKRSYIDYEKGLRNPKPEILLKLAQYYNVPTEELKKANLFTVLESIEQEFDINITTLPKEVIPSFLEKSRLVPIHKFFKFDYDPRKFQTVGYDYLPESMINSNIYIEINDDALYPKYTKSNYFLVSIQNTFSDGEIIAISLNDEPVIFRIASKNNNNLILSPIQYSEKYPIVLLSDISEFKLLGVVKKYCEKIIGPLI